MRTLLLNLTVGVVVFFTIDCYSTTRYVWQDSPGSTPPYTNWATAATNIQNAIDSSSDEDSVWVAAGRYFENIRLTNGVALYGGFVGTETNFDQRNWTNNLTIIDGQQSNTVVFVTSPTDSTRLDGFVITNGSGGVVCVSSTATIVNNTIVGNHSQTAGGIECLYGSPTIMHNLIQDNSCEAGGGISSVWAAPKIQYNRIIGNRVLPQGTWGGPGGGIFCVRQLVSETTNGLSPEISNNLIKDNTSYDEFAVSDVSAVCLLNSSARLINNTIIGNKGSPHPYAAVICSTNSVVANNIIAFNNSGVSAPTAGVFVANCVFGNQKSNYFGFDPTGINGNISADPLFITTNDYRLRNDSPCINAGNNGYVIGGTDLDGKPRIVGGTVDMGAYEFQSPASMISYAWLQQYGITPDTSTDSADGDNDGLNTWEEWKADTNPTNSESVLRLLSPSYALPGILVQWQSTNSRTYFLERAGVLEFRPFSASVSNIAGQAGTTAYLDASATNGGPFFYRVGVQE